MSGFSLLKQSIAQCLLVELEFHLCAQSSLAQKSTSSFKSSSRLAVVDELQASKHVGFL